MFGTAEQIQERFSLSSIPFPPKRYNIAPTDWALTVIWEHEPKPQLQRWGIIPPWHQQERHQSAKKLLINARAETVQTKPTFRAAFRYRRCLVIASGFFEWSSDRTPYFIFPRNRSLCTFAGLWECQKAPGSSDSDCEPRFTILTVPANATVERFHHRMPAILRPEYEQPWLHPETPPDELYRILEDLYPASMLSAYAVSRSVNNPNNDSVAIIQPVSQTLPRTKHQ